MKSVEDLRLFTKELAEEVKGNNQGPYWAFLTHLLDRLVTYSAILDKDGNILFLNKAIIKNAGKAFNTDINQFIGMHCKETQLCDKVCDKCPIKKTYKRKQVLTSEYKCPLTGEISELVCIPLLYDGISGIIVLVGDFNG